MPTAAYPPPYAVMHSHYPLVNGYPPFPGHATSDPRQSHPGQYPLAVGGASNKRLAPAQPHPSEPPAKKKQSKWTAGEDAEIIRLRLEGNKWEDISHQLPGRSAISCRLRFQNYLERRSEWDEEKKNKLARLYERFKKDMWEKIAKEMQIPWRAAEAMHWQIGDIEMAQRANVPVFHLGGGGGHGSAPSIDGSIGGRGEHSDPSSERAESISPTSMTAAAARLAQQQQHHQHHQPHISYPPMHGMQRVSSHSHSHSLPHIPIMHASQPISPVDSRSSAGSGMPNGMLMSAGSGDGSSPPYSQHPRRRADSARSVPSVSMVSHHPSYAHAPPPRPSSRATLPPLGDLAGPHSSSPPPPLSAQREGGRITLPPVVTLPEGARR